MSTPHAGNAGSRDLSLRPRPEGWPVGSFDSYADAQAAVDMLSDKSDFPVAELTIVGVDLMGSGTRCWAPDLGSGHRRRSRLRCVDGFVLWHAAGDFQ